MRKSTFTAAQRAAIITEQTGGKTVDQICREHQISPATFYNWKDAQKVEQDESRRRLDQLEKENKRLKKMYSELSIDHEILKEGYEVLKKIRAQNSMKK
jgi:putative transposase